MNGQEWTASKSDLDRESMDKILASFRAYYDGELTKLGWSTNYEDETYNFSPLATDGPGGSVWGYVKVKDGKLREVLLQKITPTVPLEELIKRVEE